ncbi:T9SS type B sorting domain-containing protein [Flavicella sediminum]|uniref:T9SS type B sorting domain-containing protein n=1 Tax=Flavicella sediminum TaxID=2585141 RepID=UPI0011207DF5|nr:T9SS type B sorting domain-containing protein [Flavicella sediminum]
MKYTLLKFFLLLLFTAFITPVSAQFSKTHYIPPLTTSIEPNATPQDQYLYISTPSTTDVPIRIIAVGGTTITGTASKNNPYVHSIGSGGDTQLFIDENKTFRRFSDKGYIIEADDLVYVTVKVNGGNGSQAGALVSKGLAGLGKEFRTGAFNNPNNPVSSLSFISIMATENNTIVNIDDLPPGISFINIPPALLSLNSGQSIVFAVRTRDSADNLDGFIGALVTSNKNIAVSCGSANGSTSESGGGRDYGFDQIVPTERIGNEYIFTRAFGLDDMENPIIVAHEDNTEVYINGDNISGTLVATLNAGEYHSIEGDKFNGANAGANLYVWTSKDVFAYQAVGGTNSSANLGLFFVPPINCETPKEVDNIPLIQSIGTKTFTGGISVLAKKNKGLKINGVDFTALGGGITVTGPTDVNGKTDYVTYLIEGLSGNVSVLSDEEVYVAAFGTNGSAAFGGYYSGFSIKPEVFYDISAGVTTNCLPNVTLSMNALTSYDEFQWYKDGVEIVGAKSISYVPTEPGNYQVEGRIICSAFSLRSDNIPVSNCPEDSDNDGIVNAIDLDNDNDGILNCTESLGSYDFDLSNETNGSFTGGYTFTGEVSTENTAATTPFSGTNTGTFVMSTPAGVTNEVTYKTTFNNPINIKLEYAVTGNSDERLTNDENFIISVPYESTVSIYNPDNQLLVDTNYDGIYESGVTHFSAFEVRFVMNQNALNFGSGTFAISASQVEGFQINYRNNSDTTSNKAKFKMTVNCIGLDSDGDGIVDHFDADSDNDGIPDITEATGKILSSIDTADLNGDGVYDIFALSSQNIVDTDADTLYDYLDLDSDNDGIYDLKEANSNATDANNDGIVDGVVGDFGANGLHNALETVADNGILNYTIADTDADLLPNAVETDADDDACNDVIEAGFTDVNDNGYLGNASPIVNSQGKVTSGSDGYTAPNDAYIIAAPIEITAQPIDESICEFERATFTITTNTTDIQWQISTDGISWNDLTNDATYSGTTTKELILSNTNSSLSKANYRAVLNKVGNACGLISDTAVLTVNTFADLTFNPQDPLCLNNTPVQLTASPAGGIFSGAGVSNTGLFTPVTATAGIHTITYTYSTSASCENTIDIDIEVYAIPNPAILDIIQTFCATDGAIPTIADLKIKNQGANSLHWFTSDAGGTELAPTENLIHNQVYFAELRNANNCVTDVRTETTVFLSAPEIQSSVSEICEGETITLTTDGVPKTAEDFMNENPELTLITTFGDSHYFVKKESMPWETANALGDTFAGASMYIINSTAEEQHVYNALQSLGHVGNDNISIWIGLKQIATASDFSEPAGGWYWIDGTPLSYSNWATNEPNDFPNNSVSNEEDYAQFEFGSNGIKWNDAINSSVDRNSWPLFEFTGTTDVEWGYYKGATEVLFPDKTSTLDVSPTETTTYFIKITTNGIVCTDEFTLTVNPLPIVTLDTQSALCENTTDVTLTASPAGGTFSGTGVNPITGVFSPSTAGPGTHTISYTFTDPKGCENSANTDITVYAAPEIIFSSISPLCIDAMPFQIDVTPAGGTFSGNGVTASGIFTASDAMLGNNTINYTFTNTNGCTESKDITITVNPLPVISMTPQSALCIEAPSEQLTASPAGGTFSGTGVSTSGLFNPQTAGVGTHTITYEYTDGNSCTNSDSISVTVNKSVDVSITPQADLCIDAAAVQLMANPTGGVFSGTGVNATGIFDPSISLAGTFTISYDYTDANGCDASTTIDITVNPLPVINFTSIPDLCIDAAAVQLIATPSGGTFSGIGVNATGLFTPSDAAAGTHTITYDYTDSKGCQNSASIDVVVNPLPVVSIAAQSELCVDANAVQLTGNPINGTFSGTGVSNTGEFNPTTAGVGSHNIRYTYVDSNGCENTDSTTITVNSTPTLTFTPQDNLCVDASAVQLIATPSGGDFSGTGVNTTGTFTPSTAGVGTHTITYTYTDANLCSNSIDLQVNVTPLPNITITDKEICIYDSIDLNTMVSTTDSGIQYEFYEADKTTRITNTNVSPTITTSYFVIAKSNSTSCETDFKELILTIIPLPTISDVTLVQCDDDADGFTYFNLREKENEISANYRNETFVYFDSKEGALTNDPSKIIIEPTAFENHEIHNYTVWARVENSAACISVAQVDLVVTTTNIDSSFLRSFESCDDYLDEDGNDTENNNDADGIATFDFSSVTPEVEAMLPPGQSYTIKYYRNQADGLAELNPISNIANYRNIGYPTSQEIWLRVDSDINNACYGFGPHIKLDVTPIPALNAVADLELCDDDTDGLVSGFDLESQTPTVLGARAASDFEVSYHRNFDDSLNGSNPIIGTAEAFPNDQLIYIRLLDKNTGCFNPHGNFKLLVHPLPTIDAADNLERCEDATVDGIVSTFNLESQSSQILGSQSSATFKVTYHTSLNDAETATNALTSPYTNTQAHQQTIYVRVENTSTQCFVAGLGFDLIVNQLPEFDVTDEIVFICDREETELLIENPAGTYAYTWRNSSNKIVGTGPSILVTKSGNYTVSASIPTSPECPVEKVIVTQSANKPVIVNFKIEDGNSENTVVILTKGTGDYTYRLEGSSYSMEQLNNNTFVDVPSGTYTAMVSHASCGDSNILENITVLNFPKFFTPDNDGENPTWGISIEAINYSNGLIKIFDKTGRLLKTLNPLADEKWDGTFLGRKMPATDYWYSLELTDKLGKTTVKTGHFSLLY